jgi:hypothetical protein
VGPGSRGRGPGTRRGPRPRAKPAGARAAACADCANAATAAPRPLHPSPHPRPPPPPRAQKDMLEDHKRTGAYYNAVLQNRRQFHGKARDGGGGPGWGAGGRRAARGQGRPRAERKRGEASRCGQRRSAVAAGVPPSHPCARRAARCPPSPGRARRRHRQRHPRHLCGQGGRQEGGAAAAVGMPGIALHSSTVSSSCTPRSTALPSPRRGRQPLTPSTPYPSPPRPPNPLYYSPPPPQVYAVEATDMAKNARKLVEHNKVRGRGEGCDKNAEGSEARHPLTTGCCQKHCASRPAAPPPVWRRHRGHPGHHRDHRAAGEGADPRAPRAALRAGGPGGALQLARLPRRRPAPGPPKPPPSPPPPPRLPPGRRHHL